MDQDRAAQVWEEVLQAYRKSEKQHTGHIGDASVVILAAYGKEQRRAGVEAAKKAIMGKVLLLAKYRKGTWITVEAAPIADVEKVFDKLLAEQEKG